MNEKEILISIIVPVYNTEKYIEECLDSLLNQTFKDFEIIIIDDGSIDNSYKICNKYKERDNRVKVFRQKNKGVSSARNKGLELSKGKYVIFVDSDDYCDCRMLELISKELFENSLISFGYVKKYKNNKKVIKGKRSILYDKNMMSENIFMNPKIGGYICNKVFSNKIIKENNLTFDTLIHYSEDLLFSLNYLKYCNKLIYIDISPYYYRMRKSSVSYDYINKKNASVLSLYSKLIDKYNNNEKIEGKLKYEYLINYNLMKKNDNINCLRWDIINDEKKILKDYNPSFKEYLKYIIVYKHISIYKILKKIKNIIEGVYE